MGLLLVLPEGTWDRLKRHASSSTFPEKIQRFDCQQSVTREQFKRLRELLAHSDFDEELIKTISVSLVPLATWCRAVGVYLSKTKFRGGPEIRPVASGYWAAATGDALLFEPDIQRLTIEELRHVHNLTVSRRGIGRIHFPGNTDCSNLDVSNKLLKDIKAQERYKQKIQQMTERKNATFIEYDCKTGIWIFYVDHF